MSRSQPTSRIHAVLIANRGEIAARIAHTCRQLGIRSIAVFTQADEQSVHIAACDEAVRISDYLDGAEHLRAAAQTGAEAIHPGYGFLAENAGFAQSVEDAGLRWVGPSARTIGMMGSKAEARRLMASQGVRVVPGYDDPDQSDATLLAAAQTIGFPVMVKPSAGGGGKGMAVVHTSDDLGPALAQARRLSTAAFGDDRLVLERYISRPRHVEVQILADAHGSCLHLFERECSVQRRHQKVIEEAPSPAFEDSSGAARRQQLYADAVRAAQAVDYCGAGTVEFILDADGQHYFLEMNTRLQVEHPVTECITGLDLVALQLQVAEGRPLGLSQDDIQRSGWSIEARLYAEDPDQGFLPSAGRVLSWQLPEILRVDAGVSQDSEVGIAYDPMLAKLVATGASREDARRRLIAGLRGTVVHGLRTNRDWLIRVCAHPAFVQGDLHTGFLVAHAADLARPDTLPLNSAIAVLSHDWIQRRRQRRHLPALRGGWRLNPWPGPAVKLEVDGTPMELYYREVAGGLEVSQQRWRQDEAIPGLEDDPSADRPAPIAVRIVAEGPGLQIEIDGRIQRFTITHAGAGEHWIEHQGQTSLVRLLPDFIAPGIDESIGGCLAPMPGRVVQIAVEEGQAVEAGQALVVLEAMKMEHVLRAPTNGVVAAIRAVVGQAVQAGEALVVVEEG